MVTLTLLVVAILSQLPSALGIVLLIASTRAARVHRRATPAHDVALASVASHASYPSWAVQVGRLLGVQLVLTGAALGALSLWAFYVWIVLVT
jgi:hypothetical protein